MARIMEVRKHVEEYPGEADGSLFVGTLWRDAVEGETPHAQGGLDSPRGIVRIWDEGVGGRVQFEQRLPALLWANERLECWVEEIEPVEGERQFRTVVRKPSALFEVLTDRELSVVLGSLDLIRSEGAFAPEHESTISRLISSASAEDMERMMRARKMALDHGVIQ
jgi:hypothetical protein